MFAKHNHTQITGDSAPEFVFEIVHKLFRHQRVRSRSRFFFFLLQLLLEFLDQLVLLADGLQRLFILRERHCPKAARSVQVRTLAGSARLFPPARC